MNFTHNNHLTYKVGGRLFGHRLTPYEKFEVNIGAIDKEYYKTSNWLNEQYKTAELVRSDYGKEFVVFYSGGTDSEILLRVLKTLGMKARYAFIRFTNDNNLQDYVIAQKVASELDISLDVIDFDPVEFYRSGQAFEFAGTIQCRQMAYLTVYHNILKMGIPAVMGGELLMRRHTNLQGSRWYFCFRENEDGSAMRFSLLHNLPLVNEWFSYTPEMMGYYLEHPTIRKLVTERYNYKVSSVSTKNGVLSEYMPSILPKVKTHGYENLMGFNAETYNSLYRSHVKRLEGSLDGIFIDVTLKKLFGEDYVGS